MIENVLLWFVKKWYCYMEDVHSYNHEDIFRARLLKKKEVTCSYCNKKFYLEEKK